MTYTYFKEDYRRQGPAVPGSRPYEQLKKLLTGIERYYGLIKENRYHMEANNTYMGQDNVLIHVIEHGIVASIDILREHEKTGKWSDVLKVYRLNLPLTHNVFFSMLYVVNKILIKQTTITTAEAIAASLADLGIKVQAEKYEPRAFYGNFFPRKFRGLIPYIEWYDPEIQVSP